MKFRQAILKAADQLELKSLRRLPALMAGHYRSPFHGNGMQFKEFRPYTYGDDIRHMSWQTTARTGHPTVKVYEEDKEMNIVLAVDISGSSLFGISQTNKIDMYLELVALFGLAALKNSDNIGVLFFNDQPVKYLPPRRSKSHLLFALSQLRAQELAGKKSDLRPALQFLHRFLRAPSMILILSDFIGPNFDSELKTLATKHELCLVHGYDDAEKGSALKGVYEVWDPESGEFLLLDGSSPELKQLLNREFHKTSAELESLALGMRSDYLPLSIQDDYLQRVVRFFNCRS